MFLYLQNIRISIKNNNTLIYTGNLAFVGDHMPNYKGHLAGATILYVFIVFICIGMIKVSFFCAIEWLLFILAGALFPDVDTKSKGQKYFYFVALLFFIFLTVRKHFEMATCCSFIIMTPLLVSHRGIFHNPWFVIITPLCVSAIIHSLMPRISYRFFLDTLFFIAGALSHIWLDLGTSQMMKKICGKKRKRWQ